MSMLVSYGSDSEDSGDDNVSQIPSSSKVTQEQNVKATPKAGTSLASTLPKPRRREGPLKITLEAPKRSAEDDRPVDVRPAKRTKIEGAGGSALLGMLPPPKNKTPVAPKKTTVVESKPLLSSNELLGDILGGDNEEDLEAASSLTLLPPSRISKGKERAVPAAEPLVDFFSIGMLSTSMLYFD